MLHLGAIAIVDDDLPAIAREAQSGD